MKPVAMKASSADEFAGVLDSSNFDTEFDITQVYGILNMQGRCGLWQWPENILS